jgi:predicted nucleotidyltransferase
MEDIEKKIDCIRNAILKNVQAKYIYLFGSHAYGTPTEESDIDILLIVPDDVGSLSFLYGDIIGDLRPDKIYFVDLLIHRESQFNEKKEINRFLASIINKGRLLYAHG